MKFILVIIIFISCFKATAEELSPDTINKAGSVAASFKAVSHGNVSEQQVKSAFHGLNDVIFQTAKVWARDTELRDSLPAFRRFLFFDYLTSGTDIIVGATNPNETLINTEAAVENLFDDNAIIEFANTVMAKAPQTVTTQSINNYDISIYPMLPSAETAQKCINCHGSSDINRPYPINTKVLGYTVVAFPNNKSSD